MQQGEYQAEQQRVRLEASLRESREQLAQAKASQELQARQAENTIEDFKAQVNLHNMLVAIPECLSIQLSGQNVKALMKLVAYPKTHPPTVPWG